jgi:hypothetical protein
VLAGDSGDRADRVADRGAGRRGEAQTARRRCRLKRESRSKAVPENYSLLSGG